MKTENQDVKVRAKNANGEIESKVVGVATYAVYDSIDEAVNHIGEEKALECLNAQVRTNEMNRVRGLNRPGGASKAMLRNKALSLITAEEFVACAGDINKINAVIDRYIEQLREESEADVAEANA